MQTLGFPRKILRAALRVTHGDFCCWCGEVMEFPARKKPAREPDNMATIEHFLGKAFKDKYNFKYLRLAHKRCNI